MAARAFCGGGKNLVAANPTFEALGEFVTAQGGEVRKVPLTSSFSPTIWTPCYSARTRTQG